MKIREIIYRWYKGEYIEDNPCDSCLPRVNHHKQHWTSIIVRTILEFLLRELKWILPFIVTLVVAVKKL